jgi:hypothetical protein
MFSQPYHTACYAAYAAPSIQKLKCILVSKVTPASSQLCRGREQRHHNRCMESRRPPQLPALSGTGAALKVTTSRAREWSSPMKGSSAFQPAVNNPPGFQGDPPLNLSPQRKTSGSPFHWEPS